MEKKTVVVLGSPRSGTSMTAGILSLIGVDMGKVRKPDPQNPRGYFEDLDFLSLCKDIIKDADRESDGFHLPKLDDIKESQKKYDNKFQRLIDRKKEEATSKMWGWKVTTSSLIIDEILPYLENPHFLIIHRNQLDVAKSAVRYTERKNYEDLTFNEALVNMHLYYKSIYEFMINNPEYPKLHLAYENIIRAPEPEVKRISNFLDLTIKTDSMEEVRNYVLSREEIKKEKLIARIKTNIVKNKITRWIYHRVMSMKIVPVFIKKHLKKIKNLYKNY